MPKDRNRDKEGTILHASFTLENQEFAAMDSALEHKFISMKLFRLWFYVRPSRKSIISGRNSFPAEAKKAFAVGSRTNSVFRGRLLPLS